VPSEAIDPNYELDPSELSLIENLSQFPAVIQKAASEYKPLHLTHALYEMARSFNAFYRQAPVLTADPDVRDFRLQLVEASRVVLAAGLNLLGIEAPRVM